MSGFLFAPEVLTMKTDVNVSGGGGIYFVAPLTAAGRKWVSKNVPLEPWQWMGGAFAVEGHELLTDLVAGMEDDGLNVAQ